MSAIAGFFWVLGYDCAFYVVPVAGLYFLYRVVIADICRGEDADA